MKHVFVRTKDGPGDGSLNGVTAPVERSRCSVAMGHYPGLPHGMCTTHSDVINKDLLTFIKS